MSKCTDKARRFRGFGHPEYATEEATQNVSFCCFVFIVCANLVRTANKHFKDSHSVIHLGEILTTRFYLNVFLIPSIFIGIYLLHLVFEVNCYPVIGCGCSFIIDDIATTCNFTRMVSLFGCPQEVYKHHTMWNRLIRIDYISLSFTLEMFQILLRNC